MAESLQAQFKPGWPPTGHEGHFRNSATPHNACARGPESFPKRTDGVTTTWTWTEKSKPSQPVDIIPFFQITRPGLSTAVSVSGQREASGPELRVFFVILPCISVIQTVSKKLNFRPRDFARTSSPVLLSQRPKSDLDHRVGAQNSYSLMVLSEKSIASKSDHENHRTPWSSPQMISFPTW